MGRAIPEIMLAILVFGILVSALHIQRLHAEPTTIIVPDNYPTIQEALNHTYPGDTVFVRAGTYYEHLRITMPTVALVGENRETTVIDGNGTGTVIFPTYYDVSISGFTIQNGSTGIWFGVVSGGSKISGNRIRLNGCGIALGEAESVIISGNDITDNGDGIRLNGEAFDTVCGNNITDNNGNGIYGYKTWDCNISENNISLNRGCGIRFEGAWGGSNRFVHNNIINNVEQANIVASEFGEPNVWDSGYPSGGNYWSDLNFPDVYGGPYQNETGSDGIVDVPYVVNPYDRDNYPFMNPWVPYDNGTIYIHSDGSVDPSSVPIQRKGNLYTLTSNISSNADGIVVERDNVILDGAGYTLQGTEAYNSKGIFLSGMNNVAIRNMKVKAFWIGICLSFSSNSTAYENNVTNNNRGVYLVSSLNNTVCENNITNNNYGVEAYFSYNNMLYHNNFVGNAQQVSSTESVNIWDDGYPSGGNYWSDYSGSDLLSGPYQNESGSDGIGDVPIVMGDNNTDHFPLTKPYGGQTDIGIVNATTSKTIVGQGYDLKVLVKVINYGVSTATFNLSVYFNPVAIQTLTNCVLPARKSNVFIFVWGTASFAKGNYTITAYAEPAVNETETSDNRFDFGFVHVGIPGDVSGDTVVDSTDLGILGAAWGSFLGDSNYNPDTDIDGTGVIDSSDLGIMGAHWGETE
jgi:parallel beta-helix repeat protein